MTLVVLDRGSLRLHRPSTGNAVTITGPDAANRQPAWSPDGRHLAWSRYDRRSTESLAKLAIIDARLETRVEHDVVFPPFYLHWRPDGRQIAMLGEGPLGLELTVLDVGSGESTILSRGGPVFFDWQSDGSLLANIGDGDDRRFELHATEAAPMLTARRPASFTAPARRPQTAQFVVAVRNGGVNELVVVDPDGEIAQRLCAFDGYIRFVVSPDGTKVAWASGRLGEGGGHAAPTSLRRAGPDRLIVHDLASDITTEATDRMPITFEWSPNSERLLYLTVDDIGSARWMRWHTWSERGNVHHDWCRPSAIEAREYLPFAEQHERGQRRWSSDSRSFCYSGTATSGQEGVWVQSVDAGEAHHVATGQMCWFAPA